MPPNVFADQFTIERGQLRAEPVARKAGAEQLGEDALGCRRARTGRRSTSTTRWRSSSSS